MDKRKRTSGSLSQDKLKDELPLHDLQAPLYGPGSPVRTRTHGLDLEGIYLSCSLFEQEGGQVIGE